MSNTKGQQQANYAPEDKAISKTADNYQELIHKCPKCGEVSPRKFPFQCPKCQKLWYEITCPECNKEQVVSPSLFMLTGMLNSGGAKCIGCGKWLHLEIMGETWATASMRVVKVTE